ncbi:MAG: hypothetical protein ACI8TP_001679 [Acidimicrobiales bacterium]|jgi:hypothetical protein
MVTRALAESLSQALSIDPGGLSGEDLANHELALQRLDAQLAAAKFKAAAAVARRPMTTTTFRRPQQWVIFETRQSQRRVNREFRIAKVLAEQLPSVLDSLERAEIQRCHIDVFVRLANQIPLAEALIRDLDDLLTFARTRQFVEFEALAEAWATMMDPTDPRDLDEAAHDNRSMVWTDSVAGEVQVALRMPTVNWEQIHNGLEGILDQMFRADWDQAQIEHDDNATVENLDRSDRQRNIDALLQLLRRGLVAGNADPGATTIVNIVVDEKTLEDETDRQAGRTVPARSLADLEDYRCETRHGRPITPSMALLLSLSGQIRRVVLNAPSLDLSSKQRLFTGNLRQGILMKHRWCNQDGCETLAYRCEVDHTIPVSRDGPTSESNGRPLCRPCHRHKTRLENLGIR